jgi:transposase
VTAEVARLVIKHRGQGMSNRQIAELYNIAPQTCSNISSRYLKTGHFRPTTKRVYKKKPTINKAQSLVLQWLSNKPLLTPRGAWLRLSTKSIFVSQKSVYNMLDKSTLSIGLVKPALY